MLESEGPAGSRVRLARIKFANYRCLRDVEVAFDQRTVLIGANGAGKTSILDALDKTFGSGRRGYGFRESDLSDPDLELVVEYTLVPNDGDTFTADEHALFETHVDVVGDVEVVLVRVVAGHEEDGVFRSRGYFLKSDGEEDGAFDVATRSAIGFFFLGASRDSQREFDDRGGLWARLSSLLEAAHDPEAVESLTADAGRQLVEAVLGEHRLGELAETVERFVAVLPTEVALSAELRATSVDFRSLLRGTSLVVGAGDELLPLRDHSTGLQSLALFGLFRAFLQTTGGGLLAVGLEEPEIHLAPHVGRSLVALASEPGYQVIFTSHAPSITDAVELREIRVLRGTSAGTEVRAVGDGLFDIEELARLNRELRLAGTEFLFARAVLLCEGASELGALPEFARKLACDLDRSGISVLPVGGGGFEPFLKLLGPEGFDIPHCVVCDNDQTFGTLRKVLDRLDRLPKGVAAKGPLDAEGLERMARAGLFTYPSGDIESVMVAADGYDSFVAAADLLYGQGTLEAFRLRHVSDGGDDDDATVVQQFGKKRGIRKPELAAEAASRMSSVPDELAAVIKHTIDLARHRPA